MRTTLEKIDSVVVTEVICYLKGTSPNSYFILIFLVTYLFSVKEKVAWVSSTPGQEIVVKA